MPPKNLHVVEVPSSQSLLLCAEIGGEEALCLLMPLLPSLTETTSAAYTRYLDTFLKIEIVKGLQSPIGDPEFDAHFDTIYVITTTCVYSIITITAWSDALLNARQGMVIPFSPVDGIEQFKIKGKIVEVVSGE